MNLKLILQVLEPFQSSPIEICRSNSSISSSGKVDEECFEKLLSDEFNEEVEGFFDEEFNDILGEAISSIAFPPKARYYIDVSYDEFRELALKKIGEIADGYQAVYSFTDSDKDEVLYRSNLDLNAMVEEWVNDREDDCGSSIDVGTAMINGMEKYVASASWHYAWTGEGDHKKPTMWFGLEGEAPEEGWILNLEDNPEEGTDWKSFWFAEDQWINRVPDADSIFLTWMEAECGIDLPLLDDVLATCPIEVSELDDYNSLTQKILEMLKR